MLACVAKTSDRSCPRLVAGASSPAWITPSSAQIMLYLLKYLPIN